MCQSYCPWSVECSWEAVFVVADKKPFPEMYTILESMNETRAWVFAEWVRIETMASTYYTINHVMCLYLCRLVRTILPKLMVLGRMDTMVPCII